MYRRRAKIFKELGIHVQSVWGILRKEGIHLKRMRSWCVSTDKEFAAKAADIIGLYLNSPQDALVISVDEKPSIQALSKKTGYVETSSGKLVRGLQSTHRRSKPENFKQALLITAGPFLVNTLLCAAIGTSAIYSIFILGTHELNGIPCVLLWLAISAGMHAFPGNQEILDFTELMNKQRKNLLYFAVKILTSLLKIANFLKIIWIDLVYAIMIILLVPYFQGSIS